MKIQIPKETVTQIMDDYHCSEEEAAKASALNYMGIREPFKITASMVEDEKYFDKLFTEWYENQKNKITA